MTGSVWRILGATCGLCMVVWLAAACAQASPDRGAPAATEPAPTLDVASTRPLRRLPSCPLPMERWLCLQERRSACRQTRPPRLPPGLPVQPQKSGPACRRGCTSCTITRTTGWTSSPQASLTWRSSTWRVIGAGDYFTADEIAVLKASSKIVLACIEIGAIEKLIGPRLRLCLRTSS